MLASLRIQNLALVQDLEWVLPAGFVAVTGETGSGKSIILGALKLVLGERADKSLIRSGAEQCSVEAIFELEELEALNARLCEQGLEPCVDGQLIIKRVFSSSGANRQFVNCSATTLGVLKAIGESLVDLHGPHDHQSLLSTEKQLELLDAFAGAEETAEKYQQSFRALQELMGEHQSLCASESSLERELDLLRHQAHEIEAAKLVAGEEEQLLTRYSQASNSRRLIELSAQILENLSEAEEAALTRLAETQRLFKELERVDPAAATMAQAHADAVLALDDVVRSVQHYQSALEVDPAQLAELEERVTLVETLKRKYGPALEDVIAFGDRAIERLKRIEGRGEELKKLEAHIAAAQKDLESAGDKLGRKRQTAAPKLAKEIQGQLKDLGFKKSEFAVVLNQTAKPTLHGFESVEFLFAPNPGEPAKPLKSIASSGEISRVMLAVKSSLAAQDRVPLLVFDEIDANVGGEIAHAVGAKMRSLAQKHQLLCITHLPQVAALAGAQFVVTKKYEGQRTTSELTAVVGRQRSEEIARMLGGRSDSALAHAETLLKGRQ